ncbi:MAG: response regulator [Opitutales bacterium]
MSGRILVLDDEENYAEMLQDLLRGNNYRVDMATRPELAIDQLEEIPYDLVISDYKMPVMDGADFLKRARELYPNLPFILVSGLMNTPELVKVANMSVTLVMEKPLDTTAFLQHVARFSEPMSEEEKLAVANELNNSAPESDGETSYPEEPRFFSALSLPAKRFMQKAWSITQDSKELFILEPSGGESELVAKDLSAWRGNRDLPVASFSLTASNQEAIEQLRKILSEPGQSKTVSIRLSQASQVQQALALTKSAHEELEDFAEVLLLYILESGEVEPSLEQISSPVLYLPKLKDRPSDVATYARRFARIASERTGKKNCAEWTAEAAFLLLAYDWPNGYREIQEVVIQAVKSSESDKAISAEILQQAIGLGEVEIPDPESRLLELMKKAQKDYLKNEMSAQGITVAELFKNLEIESAVPGADEFDNLPLIKSALANL